MNCVGKLQFIEQTEMNIKARFALWLLNINDIHTFSELLIYLSCFIFLL